MKDTDTTGPSILLVEDEHCFPRQTEICRAVAGEKKVSINVVNHLIDLPQAHDRADPKKGCPWNPGEEEPDPGWEWSIPNAANFDIVLLHKSNAYCKAFLAAASLEPGKVILYSGEADRGWQPPKDYAVPMGDDELLPVITELLERWQKGSSVDSILDEIQGERLLREKLFAVGLFCEQIQTQSDDAAKSMRRGVSALFKAFLDDGMTVDLFVSKALRDVPLRVAVKAVLAPEGRHSELWSMIQDHSTAANERVAGNYDGAEPGAVASEEIKQLLKVLCR